MSLYFFIANSKEDNDFITYIKEDENHEGKLYMRQNILIMFPSISKEDFESWNNIHTELITLKDLKREYLRFTLLNKGVIRK